MSAEDELKNEVGQLRSASARSFMHRGTPMRVDPNDAESRIAAMEDDIQALLNGLMLAGRQIDDLRQTRRA